MEYVENLDDGRKKIVCMSLGGDASISLDQAVQKLYDDRIPVIVAAGNDHKDACSCSPGRALNVSSCYLIKIPAITTKNSHFYVEMWLLPYVDNSSKIMLASLTKTEFVDYILLVFPS